MATSAIESSELFQIVLSISVTLRLLVGAVLDWFFAAGVLKVGPTMNVCGKQVVIRGHLVRIARLQHEGFEFLENPETAVTCLRESGSRIDLFTFKSQVSQTSSKYPYRLEWDNVAALPLSTFEHWWAKQIDGKTRNMVRRAEKKGVMVREVPFDRELVRGIWEIYSESPVRQGRPFPHYGKDIETVHRISATFAETSFFIGAFVESKLIGFMKLTCDDANSQAAVMHIIAMMKDRDKAPMNALIAQGVKSCVERKIPYLVYSKFSYGSKQRDSLSDFKENSGFQRIQLPRYYVPFTRLGSMAIRLGLHHNVSERLPEPVLVGFRKIRNAWYNRKLRSTREAF